MRMRRMAVCGMTVIIMTVVFMTVMIMPVMMSGAIPVLFARLAAARFRQHNRVRRKAVGGTGDNKVGRG